MNKIITHGKSFINNEIIRIEHLIVSMTLSKKKKQELFNKLYVAFQFENDYEDEVTQKIEHSQEL